MAQRLKDRLEARREGREGGFTLIELLVVIIILGILAAVVVFAVGGVGDKGQSAACVIDTRTIRTSEEAAFANSGASGSYTNMAGLVPSFLSQASTLHDVVGYTTTAKTTVDTDGPPYAAFDVTLTAAGATKCVTTGTTAVAGDVVNGTTKL